jgi:hypothetical protein
MMVRKLDSIVNYEAAVQSMLENKTGSRVKSSACQSLIETSMRSSSFWTKEVLQKFLMYQKEDSNKLSYAQK